MHRLTVDDNNDFAIDGRPVNATPLGQPTALSYGAGDTVNGVLQEIENRARQTRPGANAFCLGDEEAAGDETVLTVQYYRADFGE